MYLFADFLVLWCLFLSGCFFGYYCKYAFIYDNVYPHWHAVVGAIAALVLALLWTTQKYRNQKYSFNHYYIIFYGLICFLISGCFMITDNLRISFYFGYIGFSTIFIASFSFINLRCDSRGLRPMRIGLGNTLFFAGLTMGFAVFDEFKPIRCGVMYTSITVTLIIATILCESLQHSKIQCYKKSCDIVFNLLNDEKCVFQSTKSIEALYKNRSEFYFVENRLWLIVILAGIAFLERISLFSSTFLQLAWISTFDYIRFQYPYGPFLLLTIGCVIGTALLARYKPKFVYFMFGLIKITIISAILGVYDDDHTEKYFYFIYLYYVTVGVYSSIALQLLLECIPFLYTELALSLALIFNIFFVEVFKYELSSDDLWQWILGIGISSVLITLICLFSFPLFLPDSEGLIEIRNNILGIRRHRSVVPQSKILTASHFLRHGKNPDEFTNVRFEGNRVFQQYPRVEEKH